MAEVIIYGASDDLIEIEGAVREEYSYDEDPRATIVVIGDQGQVVEVTPILDSDWTATVRVVRPGPPGAEVVWEMIKRPDCPEDDDLAVSIKSLTNPLVYKTVKQ